MIGIVVIGIVIVVVVVVVVGIIMITYRHVRESIACSIQLL